MSLIFMCTEIPSIFFSPGSKENVPVYSMQTYEMHVGEVMTPRGRTRPSQNKVSHVLFFFSSTVLLFHSDNLTFCSLLYSL